MSPRLAELLVLFASIWVATGALFVAIVLPHLVLRLDAGLVGASWTVRLLIAPGLAVFWPLFTWRLLTGAPVPTERNAHRPAAARRASHTPTGARS